MDGKPTGEITYIVDNSVLVTVRDLSQIGELLDAVVEAGANSVSGIRFDVDDKTAALSEARKAAVQSAQAKAQELAEAAGVTLGPVQTINEYSNFPTPIMYDGRGGSDMVAMEESAQVPISTGQMSLILEVNIVYEIQ
jgi:uncharacterized protein YggE